MELTMTGNKKDIFLEAHNWEMLTINHEPRTDSFDELFAQVINALVDQVLYNYNEESKIRQKKINRLLFGLMASGMFQMISDPSKDIGNR